MVTTIAPLPRPRLPQVDHLLRRIEVEALIGKHGRSAVTEAVRAVLATLRADWSSASGAKTLDEVEIIGRVMGRLDEEARSSLGPVFNLTGTVLHTNLGRALLPADAIDAMALAARAASNLEFDLASGERGDRDDHVEVQLCRLTGAEAATVVNNNAAAVLLVLNTLAFRKEVPTSRGEMIEIGGSFRLPDIMARAGCRLREIGTTNRTHLQDYEAAIGPRTALVMKAHTSNYVIEGFTKSVSEAELAHLCRARNVPLVVDLGSGSLVDLRRFGLPYEPTAMDAIKSGADLVTFSGDKLLGGPQAGIVVGRADLIRRLKRNPLKRALRIDKITMAGLSAVLNLYRDPDRLAVRLPTLRMLTRSSEQIRSQAERLAPIVAETVAQLASVDVVDCTSQIGSGALPTRGVASAGLALTPSVRRGAGTAVRRLAEAFRRLPVPVIGRVQDGALIFDLRCLEDEAGFVSQLSAFRIAPP